ncbi:DUF1648 domain-containing protein [Sporomusa aerivorans]|uniref:DUF1648 domain-containing protein n=1 Tax=Sporomusa aerivorans TaxID=204936 RepID=UPI00352A02EF
MVSFFRKSTRPIIKFPFTNAELILEFITATSLSLMLGMIFFSWSSIPDIVPRHFSITGEIDAWGNKNFLHLPLTPAVNYLYSFVCVKQVSAYLQLPIQYNCGKCRKPV